MIKGNYSALRKKAPKLLPEVLPSKFLIHFSSPEALL